MKNPFKKEDPELKEVREIVKSKKGDIAIENGSLEGVQVSHGMLFADVYKILQREATSSGYTLKPDRVAQKAGFGKDRIGEIYQGNTMIGKYDNTVVLGLSGKMPIHFYTSVLKKIK